MKILGKIIYTQRAGVIRDSDSIKVILKLVLVPFQLVILEFR